MLSTGTKHITKEKPTLVGVQSLQEAIQILSTRKAPDIYKRSVQNIFKVDLNVPANKTWVMGQLQETETNLKKDEEDKELKENEMEGYKHQIKETTGNPPAPNGKPKEVNIADKSGVSPQNDGPNLESIKSKNGPAGEGSEGAHEQTGESQLKEAIDKVLDTGKGVDSLNQSIIAGMGKGMSQVEAHNAASADKNLMEAVFAQQAAQIMVPIFNAMNAQITSLKETIIVSDRKHEADRKQQSGLSEAIQIKPEGPAGHAPGVAETKLPELTHDSLLAQRADISKEILESYIQ